MCVNCDTNILNEALIALDPIISEHGEYNTLFILNSYYEAKYRDAFYHHPSRIELSPISLDALKALFEDEDMSNWESNTSHMPWCASLLGQPNSTAECDCPSSNRRIADGI
jgi:hypothetical protein